MTSVTRPGQNFYPCPTGVKQKGSDPSQHFGPRVPCTAPTRFNQRAQTEGSPAASPPRGPSRPRPAEAPGEAGRDRREAKGARPASADPQDRTRDSSTGRGSNSNEGAGTRGGEKGGAAFGLAPLPDALTHRSWRRRPRGGEG